MSTSVFTPSPLSKYIGMTDAKRVTVELSQEQAAVILQAHDYGIKSLPEESIELLDQIVSALKSEIWP
ncbi:MAG: hypothetical protein Q8N34_03415 [Gammaproteobacteria bacterium]|nr:hypothetical protein [Gammaproteobacteria bacterium]